MKQIHQSDAAFPKQLQQIHDPPEQLWIRDELPPQEKPHIAIVGTRHPSEAGRTMARRLASGLSSHGCVIVSGLAYGIDAEAHEAALNSNGSTIAVLGSGADDPTPHCNKKLAEQIIESKKGCLISEYPPGTHVYPHHFVARNRIVAGLSALVIIIEGGEKSGTRITAEFALSEGRDVGAVPGTPVNPMSRTPNALLKDGAAVITCVEDVLELLDIKAVENLKSEEEKDPILNILQNRGELTIDELAAHSGIPMQKFVTRLTELELSGKISRAPNGQITKTK